MGCTSQGFGTFCCTALESYGLFWLSPFFRVECPKFHKLDSTEWVPLGQEWGNDTVMNCSEQFRDQMDLEVSSEPHRGFVLLEVPVLPCPVAPWYRLSACTLPPRQTDI